MADNTASITSAPTASATGSGSSSSSSRKPQVHTVKAGAGGFKFEPQELTDVAVGDTVTWEFYPPDHSVARAEFENACVPYEYTGKDKVGFWSDTQYVKTVQDLTYFNITINSTEPIFYYCGAPDSCIGQRMVGVINPNSTQTLDKQIAAAKDASFMVKPGEPIPAEATSLHASATASSTASSSDTSHHHLGGGAIAGIVVGGIAFLAICAALFFYVGRAKSLKEVLKHNRESGVPAAPPSEYPGSPGYQQQQFSPGMGHAEMGGQLPAYGQHSATNSWYGGQYSGASSPQPGQAQMAEVKYGQHAAELASPPPGQQSFRAELEAPNKSQR